MINFSCKLSPEETNEKDVYGFFWRVISFLKCDLKAHLRDYSIIGLLFV